jgi:hypothetical protein
MAGVQEKQAMTEKNLSILLSQQQIEQLKCCLAEVLYSTALIKLALSGEHELSPEEMMRSIFRAQKLTQAAFWMCGGTDEYYMDYCTKRVADGDTWETDKEILDQ